MQAQDYGPASWSIGQRSADVVGEDVDRALAAGSIVRTHVLRPTWHFVAREDVRWLLALTGPRVHRHNDRRYRELGLDSRTLSRAQSVIASALRGGNTLTRGELGAILAGARTDPSGQRLPYILMHSELEGVISSGGLRGKQQTYALLDERVPTDRPLDREHALVELVRRYLASHGPATVGDIRWWSSLSVADIRQALHLLGDDVRSDGVEDVTFWSLAGDGDRPADTRRAHLLQAYDELLVGYSESRYFKEPHAASARAAWRDASLPNSVVFLNGRVMGLWRRTIANDAVRVQVLAFANVSSRGVKALKDAAERLGRFLGRSATMEWSRL